MSWIEALILGILQGFTEFLPVSSSGHLELGSVLFGLSYDDNLAFTVIVHGATVLSILVVFREDILNLLTSFFRLKWNEETRFISLLLVSAIPVGVVGLLFKDQIESLFTGNVVLVGAMLLITATLLLITKFVKKGDKDINLFRAIIIGLVQTIAILPGLSRSGTTITTALFLGVDREKATRFSFLMILLPIIGATFIQVMELTSNESTAQLSTASLLVGFFASFISGLIGCKLMIGIVKKGNLMYFSAYCFVVGIVAILAGII